MALKNPKKIKSTKRRRKGALQRTPSFLKALRTQSPAAERRRSRAFIGGGIR